MQCYVLYCRQSAELSLSQTWLIHTVENFLFYSNTYNLYFHPKCFVVDYRYTYTVGWWRVLEPVTWECVRITNSVSPLSFFPFCLGSCILFYMANFAPPVHVLIGGLSRSCHFDPFEGRQEVMRAWGFVIGTVCLAICHVKKCHRVFTWLFGKVKYNFTFFLIEDSRDQDLSKRITSLKSSCFAPARWQ